MFSFCRFGCYTVNSWAAAIVAVLGGAILVSTATGLGSACWNYFSSPAEKGSSINADKAAADASESQSTAAGAAAGAAS